MNNKYLFQEEYFGLSETGLYLLRNRFEYDSFSFNEINQVTLKKGKAIKNWLILLIFGLAFFVFGFFMGKGVIAFFQSDTKRKIDILEIISPFFFMLTGGYSIFKSLQIEEILSFEIKGKEYKFSTKQLSDEGLLEKVISHLSDKIEFKNELK
ncbi:MAG: hypothetical protein AB8H03_26010 [Saprospiraceae bacterium]